jgi:hypothetical protein
MRQGIVNAKLVTRILDHELPRDIKLVVGDEKAAE